MGELINRLVAALPKMSKCKLEPCPYGTFCSSCYANLAYGDMTEASLIFLDEYEFDDSDPDNPVRSNEDHYHIMHDGISTSCVECAHSPQFRRHYVKDLVEYGRKSGRMSHVAYNLLKLDDELPKSYVAYLESDDERAA